MQRIQIDLELGVDGFTGEKIVQHCLTIEEIVEIVSILIKYIQTEQLSADAHIPIKIGSLMHLALCKNCPCCGKV